MKYIIETKKEVVIDLPEYPFYMHIKTNFTHTDAFLWVKDETATTVCTSEQLYNDSTSTLFHKYYSLGYEFEEIKKEQFEKQVEATVSFLTLIPF